MSSTIATDPLWKPQTPRRRSAQIMKNLRAAVIHNHPIHYKHLLFQAMKEQQMDFVVLFQASQSSIRHEKLPLSQDLYRYRIAYDGPYETAPVLLRARWTWQALQQLSPDSARSRRFSASCSSAATMPSNAGAHGSGERCIACPG